MNNKIIFILLIIFIPFGLIVGQETDRMRTRRIQRVIEMKEIQLTSPNGSIRFILRSNPERLTFCVKMDNVIVIEDSPIIMKVDGYDLSSGVIFQNMENYEVNENYPWYGVKNTAINHCYGARIKYQNDLSFIEYILDVRVYDDGIAFRHIIPRFDNEYHTPDEYTTFIIPKGSKVWYHDLDGHYEAVYQDKEISKVRAGEWAGPPLTFELPNGLGYGSIMEANLVNYSGMALESDGRCGWMIGLGHRQPLNYPFELRYGRDEGKRLGKPAQINGTIETPWRVVMIAKDLNTLVNSTLLPNLCPLPNPKYFPQGIKTSWIKPGRAVWRYVDGGPEGYDGLKQFSKWAGELGFEYHIVEGVWSRWSMEERKAFVDYAKKIGVGVWFWKHSRDLRTPESREEFFKMLKELGVVGAKIDFFDHEAKEIIDLYEELCKKAAEYQILLNFHGANKPTGRQRTWPNELVREAVRGMEASRLVERARHQCVLPFTRFLAGPAEYTVMVFNKRRGDASRTNQIASMAILSCPLLTVASSPDSILNSPARDVIKSIPPIWDETIVLDGSKIGELVAFARRKENTWFIAMMCGPKEKSIEIPLSFLSEGKYTATIVEDDISNTENIIVTNKVYKKNDVLKIKLKAGGGFIARLIK